MKKNAEGAIANLFSKLQGYMSAGADRVGSLAYRAGNKVGLGSESLANRLAGTGNLGMGMGSMVMAPEQEFIRNLGYGVGGGTGALGLGAGALAMSGGEKAAALGVTGHTGSAIKRLLDKLGLSRLTAGTRFDPLTAGDAARKSYLGSAAGKIPRYPTEAADLIGPGASLATLSRDLVNIPKGDFPAGLTDLLRKQHVSTLRQGYRAAGRGASEGALQNLGLAGMGVGGAGLGGAGLGAYALSGGEKKEASDAINQAAFLMGAMDAGWPADRTFAKVASETGVPEKILRAALLTKMAIGLSPEELERLNKNREFGGGGASAGAAGPWPKMTKEPPITLYPSAPTPVGPVAAAAGAAGGGAAGGRSAARAAVFHRLRGAAGTIGSRAAGAAGVAGAAGAGGGLLDALKTSYTGPKGLRMGRVIGHGALGMLGLTLAQAIPGITTGLLQRAGLAPGGAAAVGSGANYEDMGAVDRGIEDIRRRTAMSNRNFNNLVSAFSPSLGRGPESRY